MLNIWFDGFDKKCIKDPKSYFNLHKKPNWFNNEWVKKVIKEIDNVNAIKDEYMESPVFGAMSPERLSPGCKCLILLYAKPDCNVYASRCGDNCAKYILELAEEKDITITLHDGMIFTKDFTARILDTNKLITTGFEYIREYINWKYGKL